MRIQFISKGSLRKFGENFDGEKVDLILFGFNGMGEVSYEKELKGETTYFQDAALLSKKGKTTVVSGCITDTRGHKRKSALVAEKGRLSGVSDMLHVTDGICGSGAELKMYETDVGKMGIIVADDLRFPETVKALALCGCDFIVCPYGEVVSELQSVLLRAIAYQFGLPIFFCGKGYCMIGDPKGELAFSSPTSPVEVEYQIKKEYHLVERRHKGSF